MAFLPAGVLSALYYADRLNQLPIGVIGIAIGTVLLPEMSWRITANDHDGAMKAQRRAFGFTLLFSIPFVSRARPCLAAVARQIPADRSHPGRRILADRTLRASSLASMHFHDEVTLVLLAVGGTIVYALAILVLFGRSWLVSLVRG
ncbi:MviN-like protein [Bradyrhizobium arachidis]|nr:MviN-like protein [Bradyrhizobium arachidis]